VRKVGTEYVITLRKLEPQGAKLQLKETIWHEVSSLTYELVSSLAEVVRTSTLLSLLQDITMPLSYRDSTA
jgi:hypothetical protein